MKLTRLFVLNSLLISVGYILTSSSIESNRIDFTTHINDSKKVNSRGLMVNDLNVDQSASDVFEIVKTGKTYSPEFIRKALSSANFCGSFYETKRNRLTFDDGSIVELKSKVELLNNGIQMNENCFLDDNVVFAPSEWSISQDGYLIKGHPHRLEKNQVTKN